MRKTNMKAGWYKQFGPANEVLETGEIKNEDVAQNEVRVRIHASGVNPSDVKKRAGSGLAFTEKRIVPHSDGAGVIEEVGEGVDPERVGERVWVFNGQFNRSLGTAAENIVLPSSNVIKLPKELSYAEGACLGIPAMTAHRCLFADGPIEGQVILVTGGAGAVGHYAIQLAKWGGAEVITTVSSSKKHSHTLEAGADHIINYRTEDVVSKIKDITDGRGVDRIVEVDFGGNLYVTKKIIKNNGVVACYASAGNIEPQLPFYSLMYKNLLLRLVLVYNMPDKAKEDACKDILQAIEDGNLKHAIAATFPLNQLVEAHEAVESGTYIGNVIVEVGGD